MLSIFNKINNLDTNAEYLKIKGELDSVWFHVRFLNCSFFKCLDISNKFKGWHYRDTILTTTEYLNHIGVLVNGNHKKILTEIEFLYYIEFILNMVPLVKEYIMIGSSAEGFSFLIDNIKLVLSKMGYVVKREEDRIILVRKDADVDSIVEVIDEELQDLLIRYKDFRIETNVYEKSLILKKIDKYIENNKTLYKQKDNLTYSLINKIVNNFDVNHPNDKSSKEKLEAYDDCFLLMIHLIRSVEFANLKSKYSEITEK